MTARAEYALRFGDNALILGQRLSEWTGHSPIVEEDLALTNVALDLVGQARMWLQLAAELEGSDRTEDDLAYMREQGAFFNVLLVEQPNGDFAWTLARQFLFDAWHHLAMRELASSADDRIGPIARKAVKEISYHLDRSRDWIVRLGDGTDESHARMQRAVDGLWTFTGELFAGDAIDAELARDHVGFEPESLRDAWRAEIASVFADATLTVPTDGFMQSGGKAGRHGEAFSLLLAEMQSVHRSVPGARW